MDDFAIRTNEWVVWNRSDWNDEWIYLAMTPTFKPRCTNRYYVAWNGVRFGEGSELARMRKKFEPETIVLVKDLRRLLPR